MEVKRSRTFDWDDPKLSAAKASSVSGMDFFTALKEGEFRLPPSLLALGISLARIEEGKASFYFEPFEYHYNPIGCVHGGIITTLLDSAMGCTVHSLLPPGTGYSTIEIKVNFIRPVVIQTGVLEATGHIIHMGRKTAIVEASMTDRNQNIYAHAVSTCLLAKI